MRYRSRGIHVINNRAGSWFTFLYGTTRMKTLFQIFLTTLILCVPSLSAEDQSPKAVVEGMAADMNAGKGFESMLTRVHWPSAYEKIGEDERKAMNVASPEDLKRVTMKFLEDPGAALTERMADKIYNMPKDKQEITKKLLEEMQSGLVKKFAKAKERMQKSVYEVGEATVEGDRAVVPLKATYEGKTTERPIELKKIDGSWYLPTSDLPGLNQSPGRMQKTGAQQ